MKNPMKKSTSFPIPVMPLFSVLCFFLLLTFPKLSIEGASKPLTLAMDFSRLNVGGDWKARTEIPAKYTRVSIEELVKMLQNE